MGGKSRARQPRSTKIKPELSPRDSGVTENPSKDNGKSVKAVVAVVSPRYKLEKYKRLIRACDCRTTLLMRRQVTHACESYWSDPRLSVLYSRTQRKVVTVRTRGRRQRGQVGF